MGTKILLILASLLIATSTIAGEVWTTPDITIKGVRDQEKIGSQQLAKGDINGDGKEDLIICETAADSGWWPTVQGKVYIFYGPLSTGTYYVSDADVIIEGNPTPDIFGMCNSCGDINGDGKDDVLIGAMYSSGGGTRRGTVYIFYGGSLSGTIPYTSADIIPKIPSSYNDV